MVQIQPVQIWNNGTIKTAMYLNLNCVFDNLKNTANFYYFLLDINLSIIADGNLQMIEPNYTQYITNKDSNAYAYNWAAENLNLTIINYEFGTSTKSDKE
jgi:hypothetical protein